MKKSNLVVGGLVLLLFLLTNSSCKVYSFSQGRVSPDIHSVAIYNFTNNSNNGSALVAQKLTNALKDRFVQQSNLRIVDFNGDIEFKGTIVGYQINGNAPTASQTTALNRLTVSVRVDFVNNINPKESYSDVTFTRYADYESSKSLSSVEDQLLTDIYTQLVDDIYNRALVNW